MKIFINQPKINARARLSNLASIGGLILLLASVVIPVLQPAWANVAYAFMIAGMGVAMVGIYFANRWVRKPRPEESLAKALKSFDDKYCLYHYPALLCDHLLLTPSGLVILETINLAGDFSYKNGKWKEAMSIGRALRYIVEERVSNPVLSAKQLEEELRRQLTRELGADFSIPIRSITVFTHPLVRLAIEHAPVPICKIDKLKKQISSKEARLAPDLYDRVASFLERKTIQ
ncbi:MAG: nuclease-related domain-containing protein [Chloroflexota bacterium]